MERHLRGFFAAVPMTWRQLVFSPPLSLSSDEVDAVCCQLVSCGAGGAHLDPEGNIVCYIDSTEADVESLVTLAANAQCSLVANDEVKQENWSERCADLWEPVTAGALRILPVQTNSQGQTSDPQTLLIIPGQGFGTGHHPTTRMIVEELSARAPTLSSQELSIIDVGTGSGILAIAAAKLFQTAVKAIDNDAYAIANAVDNVTLNDLSHLVEPSTTPLEEIPTRANLIIANIYGEVLTQMAPHLSAMALPGAVMILSGITELVRDMVVDEYTENHGWSVDSERSELGWHCVALTRP